ncbi:unnamed protein product [Phyllotreta striolata]|uniref:Uncharacterized protein n=1 Tax=Phyllotreta striolata TaxID=444603 RepID=A0A9N9TQN2_PHYSR|nr:unnamed protein product [Phyllotreta striolata]
MFDVCSSNDLFTGLLLVLSTLYFGWFSFLVQNIFNEMNQVYLNLMDFPWYNWSQQNKTLFLILLLKNLQPLEDKYYGVPALDFRFMLQVS